MTGVGDGYEVTQIFEFDVGHWKTPTRRYTASIEIIASIDWIVEVAPSDNAGHSFPRRTLHWRHRALRNA